MEMVMIKTYDEVPATIEGINFYIFSSEKEIKRTELRLSKLKDNLLIARERLELIKKSNKIENFDA